MSFIFFSDLERGSVKSEQRIQNNVETKPLNLKSCFEMANKLELEWN